MKLFCLLLLSASVYGARVDFGAGPRFPGTAISVSFFPGPHSLSPTASGFRQTASFYPAELPPGIEPMEYAILAIPLESSPGRRTIRVSWWEGGKQETKTLSIRIKARPGSTKTVHLPPHAARAVDALVEDKKVLDQAMPACSGPPQWRGRFCSPVQATRISEGFGVSRLYLPGAWLWRHKGLDLAAPDGSPVGAGNDGTVIVAKDGMKSYGGLVVLSHGYGLCSIYMHLSKILVQPGQRVLKGFPIALSGHAGIATGPHLHWQLNLNGFAVDPRPWMDKNALLGLE
jgi:murein DD-endopeptidase MepM/ murein hydrolase activator NlpD